MSAGNVTPDGVIFTDADGHRMLTPMARRLHNVYRDRFDAIHFEPPSGSQRPHRVMHTPAVRFDVTDHWTHRQNTMLARAVRTLNVTSLPLSGREVDFLELCMRDEGKSRARICYHIEFDPSFASTLEEVMEELSQNDSDASSSDSNALGFRLWSHAEISTLVRHYEFFNYLFLNDALFATTAQYPGRRLTYLSKTLGRDEWEIDSFMLTNTFRQARSRLTHYARIDREHPDDKCLAIDRWQICSSFSETLMLVGNMWYELMDKFEEFPNATEQFRERGLLDGALVELFGPLDAQTPAGSCTVEPPEFEDTDVVPPMAVFAHLESRMKRLDAFEQHFYKGYEFVSDPGAVQTCAFNDGKCGAPVATVGDGLYVLFCEEHKHVPCEGFRLFRDALEAMDAIRAQLNQVVSILGVECANLAATEARLGMPQSLPRYGRARLQGSPSYKSDEDEDEPMVDSS